MAKTADIPNLAALALQYGTIDQDQHRHLTALFNLQKKEGKVPDFGELLVSQKMATPYQAGLLNLIQDYHIIRKKGEEFGRIAVEKGFATELDIQKALERQKKEFKRSRLKKLIGDILVENRVITARQKDDILREQAIFEEKAGRIITGQPPVAAASRTEPDLSDFEKDFLRIKALDREFAASVVEKGLASETDIQRAVKVQERAFERTNTVRILGDIMVSMTMISSEQKQIILAEQGRLLQEEPDPGLSIRISPDRMSACVEINPSAPGTPTLEILRAVLADHNITHGIYPDPLLQCLLDLGRTMFPVARVDASLALKTKRRLKTFLDKDFTDRGEKRKGDLLAAHGSQCKPPAQRNIHGHPGQPDSGLDFTIRCGSGTRPSKDGQGIIAAKTGVPSLSVERFLYVHPIIHVLEDADQRYGPIEPWANLSVAGTITGAYPVTAGRVKAREIRGALLEAVGDIRVDVGITDAVIRAQGDIHARYIHNCTIETFGNLYVKNEIFDSLVQCSGKVDAPGCRVITSRIFAKNGVILAGAGSAKTAACTITAGTEHHILAYESRIRDEIQQVTAKLTRLKEKRAEKKGQSVKLFQKMVELKIFHDRAKEKKQRLGTEFKANKAAYPKEKQANILKLISNFDKRMEKSIATLKELNRMKKAHDLAKEKLDARIEALTPKIHSKTLALEQSLYALFEWTRTQPGHPKIEIMGKAFQGTRFCGIYSELKLDRDKEAFSLLETPGPDGNRRIELFEFQARTG